MLPASVRKIELIDDEYEFETSIKRKKIFSKKGL